MKTPNYLAATGIIRLTDDLDGFVVVPLAVVSLSRSFAVADTAGVLVGKASVGVLLSEVADVANDKIHDQVQRIIDRARAGEAPKMDPADLPNRLVKTHHDGHGLNDKIEISAENDDDKGVAHDYLLLLDGVVVGRLLFQKGPRKSDDSRAGLTEAAVIAVVIDRLECFQKGPFACAENEEQLTHLRAALAATKARADERARRGVLGKEEK